MDIITIIKPHDIVRDSLSEPSNGKGEIPTIVTQVLYVRLFRRNF